jgi:hypothetical protein
MVCYMKVGTGTFRYWTIGTHQFVFLIFTCFTSLYDLATTFTLKNGLSVHGMEGYL